VASLAQKKLKATDGIQETEQLKCEFCLRNFVRPTSFYNHFCEKKRRWLDKDFPSNRIGFQTWLDFYVKNSASKKTKNYLDFINSSYYLVFVKFGHYCVNAGVINIPRYSEWLFKNKIKIDSWASDTNYNKFLIEFLRKEDAFDAIARSIEHTIILAKNENVQSKDCLRYCNSNRICYLITTGKISPWMLYQSESGVKFLENLEYDQQKMIIDYINPEQWALKFIKDPDTTNDIKDLLKKGGY
jgi:hypothetical protein